MVRLSIITYFKNFAVGAIDQKLQKEIQEKNFVLVQKKFDESSKVRLLIEEHLHHFRLSCKFPFISVVKNELARIAVLASFCYK